jgi:hypothetical protein
MKTHQITGSQLRGMIKEALEESLEEFSLDDERMELARLGHSRTPEQNRRYKALLEAKLGYMKEVSITGIGKQILGLFQSGKGKQLAGKIDEDTLVKNILPLIAALIVQSGSTFDDFMSTLKGKKQALEGLIKAEEEKKAKAAPGAPGVKTGSGAQEAAVLNPAK